MYLEIFPLIGLLKEMAKTNDLLEPRYNSKYNIDCLEECRV